MFIALLTLLSTAQAACSVTLTGPADGSTLPQNPYFEWSASGDCTSFRVIIEHADTGALIVGSSAQSSTTREWRIPLATWASITASEAAEIQWRLQYTSSSGLTRRTALSYLTLDRDDDGDGWYKYRDADCNDKWISIYPGAYEVCGDSIDQDCDGADPSCG